jgi:glycosyltransferase involved in cell wall biosynthesis
MMSLDYKMSKPAKSRTQTRGASFSICIGVPTYNRPDLLERALASIAAQSQQPNEVIIGDNSRNEMSEKVYERWKSHIPHLQYIRHAENIGPAGNFLALVEASSSSYFMWLADDDALNPNHLRIVKDFLAINPSVQFLGWGFQVRNYVTGSTEHPSYLPSITLNKGGFENACSYLDQPISCYFYGLYDRSILRKSPLKRWHERKETFDWMDVAFVMHNILNYKSHFLPDNLVTYGIDEAVRPRKGSEGQSVSAYSPMPWLRHGTMIIFRSSRLNLLERLRILPRFIYAWKNTTSAAIKGE